MVVLHLEYFVLDSHVGILVVGADSNYFASERRRDDLHGEGIGVDAEGCAGGDSEDVRRGLGQRQSSTSEDPEGAIRIKKRLGCDFCYHVEDYKQRQL